MLKNEFPREVTLVGELVALIGDWEAGISAAAVSSWFDLVAIVAVVEPLPPSNRDDDEDLEGIIRVPIFKSGKEMEPALPLREVVRDVWEGGLTGARVEALSCSKRGLLGS